MSAPRLADYVLKHHAQLMSEHERLVHRHLAVLYKQGSGAPRRPERRCTPTTSNHRTATGFPKIRG